MVMAQELIVAINLHLCQITCQTTGNHLLDRTGKPLPCRITCQRDNRLLLRTDNLLPRQIPCQTGNHPTLTHHPGLVPVLTEAEADLWVVEVVAAVLAVAVEAEEDAEILPV